MAVVFEYERERGFADRVLVHLMGADFVADLGLT